MKYARIENGLVVEVREVADNFDPAEVAHKFDFRVVNLLADPAFNPATERLGGFEYVVNANSVDATRQVVALTQGEIDTIADNTAQQAEREQAKTFYAALKAGTATNAQVQRVVARLLKDAYQ